MTALKSRSAMSSGNQCRTRDFLHYARISQVQGTRITKGKVLLCGLSLFTLKEPPMFGLKAPLKGTIPTFQTG
jgi:hypothetical protein